MKKITLLLLFCTTIGFAQPGINGPSRSCPTSQGYSISNVGLCFGGGIDYIRLSGGGSVSSQGINNFIVNWTRPGTYTISVGYSYYKQEIVEDPDTGGITLECSRTLQFAVLRKTVTVISSSVGDPSTVTHGLTNLYPRKYTFTTTATGASSYVWTINNGTISGCRTCSTIQVIANSGACSISGTVRARNNCGVLSNLTRSFSRSIPRASRPSPINGPTYVGAYGDFKLYTVTPSSTATSYYWYFAPGSQFLGLSNSNQISVACNTNSTTATTLYVVAKSSCGQSTARAKTITGGINPPYKSSTISDGFNQVNEMTIVENPSQKDHITVLLPDYKEVKLLSIYTMSGQAIRSFTPKDIDSEISTAGMSKGIYILLSEGKNGVEQKKFVLK